MAFKLSGEVPHYYSDNEHVLFGFLSRKNHVTTIDLTKQFYSAKKQRPPFHARQVVLGMIKGLKRKVALNREDFYIARTERAGPNSVEYWLEPGKDPMKPVVRPKKIRVRDRRAERLRREALMTDAEREKRRKKQNRKRKAERKKK